MFQFFDSIVDLISIVIGYVVGFFTLIFNFFVGISLSLGAFARMLGHLPVFLVMPVTIMVVACILLQLINKGS